ncbi:hypothetical protein [Mucilaginibacter sp.]|uniref:hypothetical protein n=1 Tax=Mucilaginibacter sp. TaxID=1882438 RepID=UPI0028423E52|nr:hypothetical protein [Mucilaginibacter sp.]MDR3697707.1 hypothetical protein [Mucilaginibacter sp.]
MKTPGTATIRNIPMTISEKVVFAIISMLCIRFFKTYMTPVVWYYQIPDLRIIDVAYAQKRIVNPNIHDRRFALFTCGAGHGPT